MSTLKLPAEFEDLAPFTAWILESQPERYAKRLASSMAEMQTFYDAAFPRLPAIIEHCNQFELDALPDDIRGLMFLSFSLMEISLPVECWRQARVPDSGAASIDCLIEPLL